ncbi:MAG TPA: hypothetical protein PKM27_04060 [Saprospiraceae bacterium]|nr:hypothetical protein [Saprospiraceae bacterium]HNT20468.1 hypothetical protein [Saprospiraceae bacterium]
MIQSIKEALTSLAQVLEESGQVIYIKPCPLLGNASIGMHTRHILEMFDCLDEGYYLGTISYDERKREGQIETDLSHALRLIQVIIHKIDRPNQDLHIKYSFHGHPTTVSTNYYRELIYNLEHCIHHQALIRVALESMTGLALPEQFGVAPSTLHYRARCAQ